MGKTLQTQRQLNRSPCPTARLSALWQRLWVGIDRPTIAPIATAIPSGGFANAVLPHYCVDNPCHLMDSGIASQPGGRALSIFIRLTPAYPSADTPAAYSENIN